MSYKTTKKEDAQLIKFNEMLKVYLKFKSIKIIIPYDSSRLKACIETADLLYKNIIEGFDNLETALLTMKIIRTTLYLFYMFITKERYEHNSFVEANNEEILLKLNEFFELNYN